MHYIYIHLLGSYILDSNQNILESIKHKKVEEFESKTAEKKLIQKYPKAIPLPKEKEIQFLATLKQKENFADLHNLNTDLTIKQIKNSLSQDLLIIQTISNIDELDKVANILSRRLREWYSLYLPELDQKISNPEHYVELILTKDKATILPELKIEQTMGGNFHELDLVQVKKLATHITETYLLRKEHEEYLQKVMQSYCSNLLELAGPTIGARLIEIARSLKHLAIMPSSTIQLLGAEKALFRHIKTGAKSPKYGILINHPIVQNAQRENKGKAARLLADKLSLCARLDYFQGEFKAKEFKQELESKNL